MKTQENSIYSGDSCRILSSFVFLHLHLQLLDDNGIANTCFKKIWMFWWACDMNINSLNVHVHIAYTTVGYCCEICKLDVQICITTPQRILTLNLQGSNWYIYQCFFNLGNWMYKFISGWQSFIISNCLHGHDFGSQIQVRESA